MTSRCRPGHDKVIYKSKRTADRAIQAMRNGRIAATDDLIAYRCEHRPGHWHVGNLGAGPSDPPSTGHRPRFTREEWDTATLALWGRCRDLCEWCGEPLRNNLERHHRQRRAVGGDRLANLVALHTPCHAWVHAHPEDARARGFIVSAHAPDPAAVPLILGERAYTLDDEGGRHPAPVPL